MKLLSLALIISLMGLIGCSSKKEEPYYDRAKQASKEAHQQLKND